MNRCEQVSWQSNVVTAMSISVTIVNMIMSTENFYSACTWVQVISTGPTSLVFG